MPEVEPEQYWFCWGWKEVKP